LVKVVPIELETITQKNNTTTEGKGRVRSYWTNGKKQIKSSRKVAAVTKRKKDGKSSQGEKRHHTQTHKDTHDKLSTHAKKKGSQKSLSYLPGKRGNRFGGTIGKSCRKGPGLLKSSFFREKPSQSF